MVANVLAWEVVKFATRCLPVCPYVYYDLVRAAMFRPTGYDRREDCLVCGAGGLLGLGTPGIAEYMVGGAGTPPPPPRLWKGEEDGPDTV